MESRRVARTKSARYSLQSSRLNTMGLHTEGHTVHYLGFQMLPLYLLLPTMQFIEQVIQ